MRILILGMGDLGVRIAQKVVEGGFSSACLLAGKSDAATQWARLLQISSGREVSAARVDGQDVEALKALLTRFEPELIVQCATLLSPFALRSVPTSAAQAVLEGGFALQLAAQLPIVRTLMYALGEIGMQCPVINCSYPDVTHPMLAAEDLSPTIGIGNVAIMALWYQRNLEGANETTLQVVGQHAQLGPCLAGKPAAPGTPTPLVYLNSRRVPSQDLLFDAGLQGGATMNHLAAATVVPILRGFTERDGVVETHAAGVFGLPGGYPVCFVAGAPELRLPDGLTLEEAVSFNRLAAKGEGIDRIAEDGTVFYTTHAQQSVAEFCPELAEPLRPQDVEKRFQILQAVTQAGG
jgi:energy-converting hydrogenase Eha subunit C